MWLNGELGNPAGAFSFAQAFEVSITINRVVLGDVDRDGDLDAFMAVQRIAGFSSDGFKIWLNGENGDPSGVFSLSQTVPGRNCLSPHSSLV